MNSSLILRPIARGCANRRLMRIGRLPTADETGLSLLVAGDRFEFVVLMKYSGRIAARSKFSFLTV